jgi:hypothetical protein
VIEEQDRPELVGNAGPLLRDNGKEDEENTSRVVRHLLHRSAG